MRRATVARARPMRINRTGGLKQITPLAILRPRDLSGCIQRMRNHHKSVLTAAQWRRGTSAAADCPARLRCHRHPAGLRPVVTVKTVVHQTGCHGRWQSSGVVARAVQRSPHQTIAPSAQPVCAGHLLSSACIQPQHVIGPSTRSESPRHARLPPLSGCTGAASRPVLFFCLRPAYDKTLPRKARFDHCSDASSYYFALL